MGMAEDWQSRVIKSLNNIPDLILFNPRRSFSPALLDEQVNWELDALESADKIFMWLPDDSKAPISLFEAGLFWWSGKLILGAGPGFYRRRNLEITAARFGMLVFSDLQSQTRHLLSHVEMKQ